MTDTSNAEIDRLEGILESATIAWQTIGILCYSAVTIYVFIVLHLIVLRRKIFHELPLRVKQSLIGYALYAPLATVLQIVVLAYKGSEATEVYMEPKWRILFLTPVFG